ncbi:MAG: CsbD family protein [Chryseolinea sp.]
MNALQLKGTWKEVQGKLKQKYAQLTDNDLMFTEGKEDEMLGKIEKRIGKSKEEIKREIESLELNS